MPKKKKPARRRSYTCSYAYDVSSYRDFRVLASSEEEAEKLCQQALDQGRLDDVTAEPNEENVSNWRVMVFGEACRGAGGDIKLPLLDKLDEIKPPPRKG